VPLKPFDKWPKGMDKEKLTTEMNDALEKGFPGVEFTFSQYIQDNVQEAASGVKGENSVKVFGPDLETLAKVATEIKKRPSPPCPASPTWPFRLRSASRRSASTSTAPRPPAMVSPLAISTLRCRQRSAARRQVTSMRMAATGTSR